MIQQPEIITNFKKLADRYQVFVFPIYGILHDGSFLSEDAFAVLENLSRLNKTVAIFSNVARRRHTMIQELATIGIVPSLYQHIITAGEETHQYLKERYDKLSMTFGKKCYVISSSDSLEVIEGTGINRVRHLEDADFILTLSADEWNQSVEQYLPVLKEGIARKLKMICGGPDLCVSMHGKKEIRAGAIAQEYEKLGGNVFYIGKPKTNFYQSLAKDLDPYKRTETLIIGDSIKVDILGAFTARYDSLLYINETTVENLCLSQTPLNDVSFDKVLEQLSALDVMPTYMTKQLIW